MAMTKLEHMVDPEVLAGIVRDYLPKVMKFSALARIDRTLEGRPGSTITVPKFKYIGDATEVDEGASIDTTLLETSTEEFTIKKAAKGVEITDEAILSGFGDPVDEAGNQLALSIAAKVDTDIMTAIQQAVLWANSTAFDIDAVSDAIDSFEDETDETLVLVMNRYDASELRKAVGGNWERASDLGDQIVTEGVYGAVLGAQVMRSDKLPRGVAYLTRPEPAALYMKRDVEIEEDRDVLKKTTIMTADQHYGAHLYDESKIVALHKADEVTATISDEETTGFTLSLSPAVDGLTADDMTLLDSDDDEVTIDSVSTSDDGASYDVEATLSAGSTYTIKVDDQPGYTMDDAKDVDAPD